MPTVERRPRNDGSAAYRVKWRDPNGVQRSRTLDDPRSARAFSAEVDRSLRETPYRDPMLARQTLAAWADRYFDSLAVSDKTRVGYESSLKNQVLPALGHLRLEQVTPAIVEAWVSGLREQHGAWHVRNAFKLLRAMMNRAVTQGVLTRSPCAGVSPPPPPQARQRFLSAQEVAAVADASGTYTPLILLMAYTGLRWGEAVACRGTDVLGTELLVERSYIDVRGKLHVGPTKNGRKRRVPLPKFLRGYLSDAPGLLFTTPGGSVLRAANFRTRVWLPAIREASLEPPPRVHDLRHTYAALAVEAGVNPKRLQSYMGHSSISVTLDTYGHLYPSSFGAEVPELEALFAKATAVKHKCATRHTGRIACTCPIMTTEHTSSLHNSE